MNLQICFVNDSGSDKDSDADDSKTETSLDTPLSPMVRTDDQSYSISPEFKNERNGLDSWNHTEMCIVIYRIDSVKVSKCKDLTV